MNDDRPDSNSKQLAQRRDNILFNALGDCRQHRADQWMGGGFCPSVIRLQSLDDCLRVWTDMPDFARSAFIEARRVLENREGGLRRFRIRQGRFVLKGKRVNQMVKRRTEIVETISQDLRNNRWRRTNKFSADDIIAAIQVDLIGDRVRATIEPSIDFRPQRFEVLLRSF